MALIDGEICIGMSTRRSLDSRVPVFRLVNHWCERGDSNPHGFTRQILSLVRLPIPPLSHCGIIVYCLCWQWGRCAALLPKHSDPAPSGLVPRSDVIGIEQFSRGMIESGHCELIADLRLAAGSARHSPVPFALPVRRRWSVSPVHICAVPRPWSFSRDPGIPCRRRCSALLARVDGPRC